MTEAATTDEETVIANELAAMFEGDDGERIHLGLLVDPDEREAEGKPRAIDDGERQAAIGFLIGPIDGLRPYHRNPRRGDVPAIRSSLRANGQFRPIVVNRGTRASYQNEVLAGNHTLMGAGEEGWRMIARTYVDVDDETAAKIVLADNRTSDLGEYDQAALIDVLRDVPDLAGTGYTQMAFEGILKEFERAAGAASVAAPDQFKSIDPDDEQTDYECPSCGYGWRGKPK